jgi:RNA polymerase sigma factor FliA
MLECLSDQDIGRLWAEWGRGKELDTRNALALHYLPIVQRVSRRLQAQMPPSHRDELYGFGVLGLLDAIEKFDPSLGYRFETYSYTRVMGAMKDGLRQFDWLPRSAKKSTRGIVHQIRCVDFKSRSLEGVSLEDSVADPNWRAALEVLEIEADHAEVVDAVASALTERERHVIVEYYYRRRTLADIGAELGLTESRISQVHRKALACIRHNLMERLSA